MLEIEYSFNNVDMILLQVNLKKLMQVEVWSRFLRNTVNMLLQLELTTT